MINPLRRVEVNRFTLHHPMIVEQQRGLQIAQISDVHMGNWVKPRHMEQIIEYVDAQHPHLIALTGDYVGYNKKDIDLCVNVFKQSTTPSFAILGNHDHWTSTELSHASFERANIPLLTNEHVSFDTHTHGSIEIVGVDDLVTKHADVDKAFADLPKDRFCLTLNHVPKLADACVDAGAHLVLSGHTHNFQFNIPKITNRIAGRFGTRFYAGAYRLKNAFLYINRGLGSASWPVRIRSTPELTFITLAPGKRPLLELNASELISIQHHL